MLDKKMTFSKKPFLSCHRVSLSVLMSCYLVACSDGSDGNDGLDGTPGADSNGAELVLSSDEPAGENCSLGGVKIETGSDDNHNEILETEEVDATEYICAPQVPDAAALSLGVDATGAFSFSWPEIEHATHYRLLEDLDGASGYSLVATIPNTEQTYSHSVPIIPRLNARFVLESCNTVACSISNVATVSAVVNDAIGFIKANYGEDGDWFGSTLDISGDGNVMAVGSPFDNGAGPSGIYADPLAEKLNGSGAVFMFNRIDGVWQQTAYLKAEYPDEDDTLGVSLALSDDGLTMVVGCIGDDSASTGMNADASNNDLSRSGAAYVFVFREGRWQQHSFLKANVTDERDWFGWSVDINHDGTRLVVGAMFEDGADKNPHNNLAENSGAAYVFDLIDDKWQQTAYLKADNSDGDDAFGTSVAISGIGDKIAVGAELEQSAASGVNGDQDDNSLSRAGAAYVFHFNGVEWEQQAYLKPSSTDSSDGFGIALSLNFDGDVLAVGNQGESSAAPSYGNAKDNSLNGAGSVEIFRRSGEHWQHDAYLKAGVPGERDLFGNELSLSPNGAYLIVGAPREASAARGINGDPFSEALALQGAAYVFKHDGDHWQQLAYLKSPVPDGNDSFGGAARINNDGAVVVSADSESSTPKGNDSDPYDNSVSRTGAVYSY